MELKYIIQYVPDIQATLNFYKNAFDCSIKFLHLSGDYGELDTGNTILAFSSRKMVEMLGKSPLSPDPQHPAFEIAFESDSVNVAYEKAISCGALPK